MLVKAKSSADQSENEEGLTEEEQKALQDKGFGLLEKLLDETENALIPVYESTGSAVTEQPYALSSFQSAFDVLNSFTANHQIGLLNSIQIHEYLFHYYTLHCPKIEREERMLALKTPDGRHHAALIADGRKHEVERIVFDRDTPEQAWRTSRNAMYALRFSYQLLQRLSDTAKQNLYYAEAAALSTSIAVISMGTVIIPPEILQYTILLADAATATTVDIQALEKGKTVTFSIAETNIDLNYYDLLYIFSFLQSEEQLLSGMNKVRNQIIPGNFAVSFQNEASFDDKSFTFYREFSDFLESETDD